MSKGRKTNYVTQQQLNTLRGGKGIGHIHTNKETLDMILFDEENNAVYLGSPDNKINFYVFGELTAGGIGSDSGGGGGTVASIKVGTLPYLPDDDGVVTLPDYYGKSYIDSALAGKQASLGTGTEGQILKWTNGAPAWGAAPASGVTSVAGLTGEVSKLALQSALELGSLAYKSTLAATDIPSLAISKITGLQDALDAKQGTISDLSTIRTRADEGHTAYGYFSNGKLPWGSLSNIPSDLVYDAGYVHTDNNFTTAYKTLLDYFGYDATNHAVYLKDITVGGKKLSFYAYGELTAGGVGSGSGGGGLIEEVYGYSDLGGTYSDSDKTNTFNAYTTARLAARITALEGSATAVSYTPAVTSGTALGTITIDNVGHTIYAPTGVTSLGGQSGAITVRGGQTAPGSVNLAMSGTQLQASIVGLGSAAYTASTAYATATQGTNADTAYGWGNHASAGYATQSWVEGKNYLPTQKIGLQNFDLWDDNEIGFQEWTPSTLNTPAYYGTSLNFRDETSWYYRLAFSCFDRIFYYRGINTTTMSEVGALAYTSDLDNYQPLATAINTSNIGSQSVAYAAVAGSVYYYEWRYDYSGDFDDLIGPALYAGKAYNATHAPYNYYAYLSFGSTNYHTQLNGWGGNLAFRGKNEAGWSSWYDFIHSGNISSQSVAYASSIASHTLWGQTFNGTQDVSGGLSGVTSINGRQITWNQLCSDGEAERTLDAADWSGLNYLGIQTITGHRYFISATINSTSSSEYYLAYYSGQIVGPVFNLTNGKLETIWQATGVFNLLQVFRRFGSGVSSTVKNVMVFDLTQMFGAGNEPSTVEQFRAMFPADYYPYNAGVQTSSPLYHGGIFTDGPIVGATGLDVNGTGHFTKTVTIDGDAEWPTSSEEGGELILKSKYGSTSDAHLDMYHYLFRVHGNSTTHLLVNILTGDVGIGTMNPTEKLHVAGNILATGEITAGSDARWKHNVTPVINGIDAIMALQPCEWEWNSDNHKGSGLIAQDVQQVLPHLVKTDGEGYLHLTYDGLHAYEIAALQSHETRIEALERRVAELEKRLNIN